MSLLSSVNSDLEAFSHNPADVYYCSARIMKTGKFTSYPGNSNQAINDVIIFVIVTCVTAAKSPMIPKELSIIQKISQHLIVWLKKLCQHFSGVISHR